MITKCSKCNAPTINYNKCINCGYYDRDNAKKLALEKISELEIKLTKLNDMLTSKETAKPNNSIIAPFSDIHSPNMVDQLTRMQAKLPKLKGSLPKGFKYTTPTSHIKGALPKGYKITSVDTQSPVETYFGQYGDNRFIGDKPQKKYKQKPQKISGFTKLLLGLGIAKIKQPEIKAKQQQKETRQSNKGTLPKGF